jgi:PhnB protein
MSIEPIPSEYPGVTSYIIVGDGAAAIDFYVNVFGAVVIHKMDGPEGKIMHSELSLCGGRYMLASEFPEMGFKAPESYGGTPVSLLFYVTDVDAVFAGAIEAGATEMKPVRDEFYGDRTGTLKDPFGHVWTIATHVKDIPPEEWAKAMESMGDCPGG